MEKHLNSSKRVQINKAQATMVGIISACVFIAVFSLVSSRALWKQRSYQARVIAKKENAVAQLKENIDSVNTLVKTYSEFTGAPENVLGGNPSGTGEKDGDNARIVLDALPSKYDYPALTSSLEKILTEKKIKIVGIKGKDDEVAQEKALAKESTPKSIEMPFQVTLETSYTGVQDFISTLEKSIRPISMQKIIFTGSASNMAVEINGNSYYQPVKTLNIRSEVVK